MESSRSVERRSESDASVAPVSGNKVERVAQHMQHLVDDLKTWVDLRIELAQLELEERVEAKANQLALGIVIAGVLLLGVVFALVTVALGLGAWLGHPAWGFLIVTGLLFGGAAVLRAARPELVRLGGASTAADDSGATDRPPDAA